MGCDQCKDWDDCSHLKPKDSRDDWFSPSEIRWCPHQLKWLIKYVYPIESGYWPPECAETTHSKGVSHHASFEMACLITGEIAFRLKRTGKDGEILVLMIQSGKNWREHQGASDAFHYCLGKRRMQSFKDWKASKKHRGKQSN